MSNAIHLYRNLLKGHKLHLPPHLRLIGDQYVRAEFKRHKNANEKYVKLFMNEWNLYLNDLAKRPIEGGKIGKELTKEQLKAMTTEQKEQLKALKEASLEVGNSDKLV